VPKSDGDNGPEDPAGDDNASGKNHNEILPDDYDPRSYTKFMNQTTTTLPDEVSHGHMAMS